jgi:hypothetical protein
MNQTFAGPDGLLLTIVLATLAVGLPIVFVLAIRFLWDRSLSVGRSKELEKLIWQLHRIASAMEHQMNLSFPAVQPGTEEPQDLAYLRQMEARPLAPSVAPAAVAAVAAASAPAQVRVQPVAQAAPVVQPVQAAAPAVAQAAAESGELPPLETRQPGAQGPKSGVNSMFGF